MGNNKLYMFVDGSWLPVNSSENMGYKSSLSHVEVAAEYPENPIEGQLVYLTPYVPPNTLKRRVKMAWLVLINRITVEENQYDR